MSPCRSSRLPTTVLSLPSLPSSPLLVSGLGLLSAGATLAIGHFSTLSPAVLAVLAGGQVCLTAGVAWTTWTSQRRHQALLDHDAALVWDLQAISQSTLMGTFVWEPGASAPRHTPEFLELFGLPLHETFSSEEVIRLRIHPEERELALQRTQRLRQGDPVPPQTFRILLPNGAERVIWMDVRYQRLSAGQRPRILGIARDVTHRHTTARALEESHARMQRLMKALPGAVFQLQRSAQGVLTLPFLSEGAIDLFSLPAPFPLDSLPLLLQRLAPTHAKRFQTSLTASAVHLSAWQEEFEFLLEDGLACWVRFDAVPYQHGEGLTWYGVATDVTEAKRAEQRLRFTQFAMDHARDAMTLVTPSGRRLYVNEETCRLTGRTREELLEGTIFDTLVDLQPATFDQIWRLVERDGTHVVESTLRTKSGEQHPIEVSATFLEIDGQDVLFAVTRDISARKASEAALRKVESRVRMTQYALDHAQDLVSIMDANGQRLYVNDAFCHFTGRSYSELAVEPVWKGVHSLDETLYRELWLKIKQNGSLTLETELQTASGEYRPVEVNCSYLTVDGIEAVCTVSRDLTARRAAEKERQLMEQQLRETQKLESLGVLAGGVAHDFNNLLTGILGNASLARDRLPETDPLHGPLQQVEKAAIRAAELCQQMLAYAGKGRVVVGPVDISTLVSETANLLNVTIAHRAVLELRLGRRLPLVQADATQIRQIVMNLVLNAAEAIDRTDGRIIVSTGSVQMTQELINSARVTAGLEPGECVFLEVRDNGIGMDAATLERIFEPFFTTKFTGRGLGLAAVLGIVRSHQGALFVDSRRGEGTTFRLILSPEPTARRLRVRPEKKPTQAAASHGRVLIIDDEESVRQVATQALERQGFQVASAPDGEVGLQVLRSAPNPFHVVLLDFTMPHGDGATILRQLRESHAGTPVVMMSGFTEEETRQRLGTLAIEGFLAKPFNLTHLRSKVDTIIKAHTPAPPLSPA